MALTVVSVGATPLSIAVSGLFNGNKTTQVSMTAGPGQFIGADLGSAKNISQMKWYNGASALAFDMNVFVAYSDNGSSWSYIGGANADAATKYPISKTANTTSTINFSSVGAHRYWQLGLWDYPITITATELEMLEDVVANPPVITITNATRTRLSHVSGMTRSTITFRADQDIVEWEARADGDGHGSGDLVGSGVATPGYTADLCTGGTPISGGYDSGAPPAEAYDGLLQTSSLNYNGYLSSQAGTAVANAYNGYTWGDVKRIKRLRYYNASAGGALVGFPSTVTVKGSNNGGGSWTTVQTFNGCNTTAYNWNILDITSDNDFTTWAIFGSSLASMRQWGVGEVEMMAATPAFFPANTDITVDIDDTELTWGDRGYRINIYGKNAAGEWSAYG